MTLFQTVKRASDGTCTITETVLRVNAYGEASSSVNRRVTGVAPRDVSGVLDMMQAEARAAERATSGEY